MADYTRLKFNYLAGTVTGSVTGLIGVPLMPIRTKVKATTPFLKALAKASCAPVGLDAIRVGTTAKAPIMAA